MRGPRIWRLRAVHTGWALTLLSEENLAYASTCQTIGLNTGYLMSYTVFLALNSAEFACVTKLSSSSISADGAHSQKWGIPRLSMGSYLFFCASMSFLVTIWLFFVKEVYRHLHCCLLRLPNNPSCRTRRPPRTLVSKPYMLPCGRFAS